MLTDGFIQCIDSDEKRSRMGVRLMNNKQEMGPVLPNSRVIGHSKEVAG